MAARRMAASSPADTVQQVVRHLSPIHPALAEKEMIRDSAVWSWDKHRWATGAFCWFMPGQHTELHKYIVEPEGRIMLAGEHTSLSHSWMQGALESGVRAVQVILNNQIK
jgi:monoamine oxidase